MLNLYFKALNFFSNKSAEQTIKNESQLNMFWWKGDNNFGDEINPILVNKMTGKKIHPEYDPTKPNLFAIGSVLNFANRNSIVWGTGFLKKHKIFKVPPAKICSVRGHLSRDVLNKLGIEVKAVGDLGLIVPDFFSYEKKSEQFKIGIIPHYADKNSDFIKKVDSDDILIIDIQGDIQSVINQINSCEIIFSTSLHGLIIADAYGVEAHWIRLSNGVVGGNFKFHDYFSSVTRPLNEPINVTFDSSIKSLLDARKSYTLKIDKQQIYESSPFNIS